MATDRLSLLDAGWLMIEGPERPMHTAALSLVTLPEGAGPDFIRETVVPGLLAGTPRPPFNKRLTRPNGRAGQYRWETAVIDLSHHVRHLALPRPGRIRELFQLVSQFHASLLDRHRPLWEVTFIEGLDDGRAAMYFKSHHAMLDGVAAMRQLTAAFTSDPTRTGMPAPWSALDEPDASPPSGDDADIVVQGGIAEAMRSATAGLSAAGGAAGSMASAMGALSRQVRAARQQTDIVAPYQAPRTILNTKLTGSRRFVAQSYEFDRIRDVGKAHGCTVNDVSLALCGHALRDYLITHNALPDDPLIAMVPVSIRDEESTSGNSISMVLTTLATDVADPVRRLHRIRESMQDSKDRLRAMSRSERRDYGMLLMTPILLGQMTGLSGRTRPLHNVVISNVPGPSEAQYWNGVRLDGLYPVSLLTTGYALNITQVSYAGNMEFGIIADRANLPSVQRMIDHIEDGLLELEKAA